MINRIIAKSNNNPPTTIANVKPIAAMSIVAIAPRISKCHNITKINAKMNIFFNKLPPKIYCFKI